MAVSAKVYLIGAGPGDPGLLTLRGKEILECADVVVYDRLVSPAILGMCNPKAKMVGIDYWGKEYASFSKQLCENNSKAEGVYNTSYMQGDARHLDFEDETFDAVTSNYVYHNITGVNKQELLYETLRVLKKGGTFAIHDIMSKRGYGDMQALIAGSLPISFPGLSQGSSL